jgi:hypothetical protein
MKYFFMHACGIVKKQRGGMPKDFKNERHMIRGEFDVRSRSCGITASLWKDRKGILFLSNFHDPRRIKMGPQREFHVCLLGCCAV